MRISVFGMGYVGSVTAACLCVDGHQVIGVDVNPRKVDGINAGEAPIAEPGLQPLIERGRKSGVLEATTDGENAVERSDLSLVCVGTPSLSTGGLDTTALRSVAVEIAAAAARVQKHHTLCFRSTMLPGTCEEVLIPAMEAAGADLGSLSIVHNPEFLREGSSVGDFRNPPKTVVGEYSPGAGDLVVQLYEGVRAPVFRVPIRDAEACKYVDNAFHAAKVAFANEVATVCAAAGANAERVLEIFRRDDQLNISEAYLRPGFAFGGSCLPKDLRALSDAAQQLHVAAPLLGGVLAANEAHLERALRLVEDAGDRHVTIFGLAFKSQTDELRESPYVWLAERLLGKGFSVRIYDDQIRLDKLTGANEHFLREQLPHIHRMLVSDIKAATDALGTAVLGTSAHSVLPTIERARPASVIDLVGIPDDHPLRLSEGYAGIAW